MFVATIIGLVACQPITATSVEDASPSPLTPVPGDLLETPPTARPSPLTATVVPVAIEIPAIGLQTSVEPMMWEITLSQRRTHHSLGGAW